MLIRSVLVTSLTSLTLACGSSPAPEAAKSDTPLVISEPASESVEESPEGTEVERPQETPAVSPSDDPAVTSSEAEPGFPNDPMYEQHWHLVKINELPVAEPILGPWSNEGLAPQPRWPYYKWDSAKAYVFNVNETFGPGASLHAWRSDKGLHADAREVVARLGDRQSRTIASLVRRGRGEFLVSKCAFPRHGIVFFAGDKPVGSVSVCFECGDILIWPADRKKKRSESYGRFMGRYKKIFPKWEAVFRDQLQLPLSWPKNAP